MDIFFQNPSDIPLPPDQVRIRDLRAETWPDGRRVRVTLELTPFLKKPSGEITISNAQGEQIASISIIETINPKMEFTLHLREPEPAGQYSLSASVFYQEDPEENEANIEEEYVPPGRIIVDQAESSFVVDNS